MAEYTITIHYDDEEVLELEKRLGTIIPALVDGIRVPSVHGNQRIRDVPVDDTVFLNIWGEHVDTGGYYCISLTTTKAGRGGRSIPVKVGQLLSLPDPEPHPHQHEPDRTKR